MKYKIFSAALLIILLVGCAAPQNPPTSFPTQEFTPFKLAATQTPVTTETSHPRGTLIFTPTLTLIISSTSIPVTNKSLPENTPDIFSATLDANPISVSGWFPIPKITHPAALNPSVAQSFIGLKIPPMPTELVDELNTGIPYGEVPPETVFYELFLVRKGNARMLWLGIPFKESSGCCGKEPQYRIFDSIPFPPIEMDNLLIPFVCTRKQEPDLFLIVVAEVPENGAPATDIRYAWRIDQTSSSLQAVSTQNIVCSPNW